jgi:hypothetical protein
MVMVNDEKVIGKGMAQVLQQEMFYQALPVLTGCPTFKVLRSLKTPFFPTRSFAPWHA